MSTTLSVNCDSGTSAVSTVSTIVLNTRVHGLLRLTDRFLNDLLSEGNIRSFIGLLHKTLLNPVLGKKNLETPTSSSTSCGTGMSTMRSAVRCGILSSDTIFGNFTNCSTISSTGTSSKDHLQGTSTNPAYDSWHPPVCPSCKNTIGLQVRSQTLRCSSHPSTLLRQRPCCFSRGWQLKTLSKQLHSGACHLSSDSGDSEPNYLTKRCGRAGEQGMGLLAARQLKPAPA